MKNESWFWREKVKPALIGLDPVRIEDKSGQGVPDVDCIGGNIELKYTKIPRDLNTLFCTKLFRKNQVPWIFRRWNAGGSAWALIGLESNEFILLNGHEAYQFINKVPWEQMLSLSLPMKELRTTLRSKLVERTRSCVDRFVATP